VKIDTTYNIVRVDDVVTFEEEIECKNSYKWIEAMQEELMHVSTIQVWDLVEIYDGVKTVGYKWVSNT
jgi:hypothetical protein